MKLTVKLSPHCLLRFGFARDEDEILSRVKQRDTEQINEMSRLRSAIYDRKLTEQRLSAAYATLRADLYDNPGQRYEHATPLFAERLSLGRAHEHCIEIAKQRRAELEEQLAEHEKQVNHST